MFGKTLYNNRQASKIISKCKYKHTSFLYTTNSINRCLNDKHLFKSSKYYFSKNTQNKDKKSNKNIKPQTTQLSINIKETQNTYITYLMHFFIF